MPIKFARPFSRRRNSDAIPQSASTSDLPTNPDSHPVFRVIPRNTLPTEHENPDRRDGNPVSAENNRHWGFEAKMAPGVARSIRGAPGSTDSSISGPLHDSSASSSRFSSNSTPPPLNPPSRHEGRKGQLQSHLQSQRPPSSFHHNYRTGSDSASHDSAAKPMSSAQPQPQPPSRGSENGSSRFSLRTFTLRGGHPAATFFNALKSKKSSSESEPASAAQQPSSPGNDTHSISSDDETLANKRRARPLARNSASAPDGLGLQSSLLGSRIDLGDSFGEMIERSGPHNRASVYGIPPPSAVSPASHTWLSPSSARPTSRNSQFSFDARRGDQDEKLVGFSAKEQKRRMSHFPELGSPAISPLPPTSKVASKSAEAAMTNRSQHENVEEGSSSSEEEEENIFQHLQPKSSIHPYTVRSNNSRIPGSLDPSLAPMITSYGQPAATPAVQITPALDPNTKVMTPAQFNESRRKMEQEALEKTREKKQRHLLRASNGGTASDGEDEEDSDETEEQIRIRREKSVRRKRNDHLAFRQSMIKSTPRVTPLSDLGANKMSMSTPDLQRLSLGSSMSALGGVDDEDDIPLNMISSHAHRPRMAGRTATMTGGFPSIPLSIGPGAAAAAGFGLDVPMRPNSVSGLGAVARHSVVPVFARNLPADIPGSFGVPQGGLVNIIQHEEMARNARRGSHFGGGQLGLGTALPPAISSGHLGAGMGIGMGVGSGMGPMAMNGGFVNSVLPGQNQYVDIINRQNEMMNAMQAQIIALQQSVHGSMAGAPPARPQSTFTGAFAPAGSHVNLTTPLHAQRAMSMISPAPGWNDMEIPVTNRPHYAPSHAGSDRSTGTSSRYRRVSSFGPTPPVTAVAGSGNRRSMLGQVPPATADNMGQELFVRQVGNGTGSTANLTANGLHNLNRRPVSALGTVSSNGLAQTSISSTHLSATSTPSSSSTSVPTAGKRGSNTTVEVVPEEAEQEAEEEDEAWAAIRRRKQQQQRKSHFPTSTPSPTGSGSRVSAGATGSPSSSNLQGRNPNRLTGSTLSIPGQKTNGVSNRYSTAFDSFSHDSGSGGLHKATGSGGASPGANKASGSRGGSPASRLSTTMPIVSITPPPVPSHGDNPQAVSGAVGDYALDEEIKGLWKAGVNVQ